MTSEDEELAHSHHSNHTHRLSESVVGGSPAAAGEVPVDMPDPSRSDNGGAWEVADSNIVHDGVVGLHCQQPCQQ